jgi:maltokinase
VIEPGASAELARRLAPNLVTAADPSERVVVSGSASCSVVVGEAVIVRWFHPPLSANDHAVTLSEHLHDVGFTEVPTFFGAEVIDGQLVATASAYLPGAVDGWQWYLDQLSDELDSAGPGGPTRCVAVAARLGALAGRLHLALAAPSRHVPLPVGWGDAADEHGRALAVLDAALDGTTGRAGELLRSRAERVRASIDSMAKLGPVDVQNIHGNLLIGRILRRGETMWVTDGAAMIPEGPGRAELRSAMVDLASLMQSLDHVARVVIARSPHHAAAGEEFVAEATAAMVGAYGRAAPVEPALLSGLRATQLVRSLAYAAAVAPQWSYVPEAALAAMYP